MKYKLYCTRCGKIFDENMNEIRTYISNKEKRPYIAFNTLEYTRVYLHRVIAYLYVEGYRKELVVDHRDNNSLNNNISNLQYLTNRDNIVKEAGKETVVVNIYNKQRLTFKSKSDFFSYFKISSSSIKFMINRFKELNVDLQTFLKIYTNELTVLQEDYRINQKDSAANTVQNLRMMISEGWIPSKYSYHQ